MATCSTFGLDDAMNTLESVGSMGIKRNEKHCRQRQYFGESKTVFHVFLIGYDVKKMLIITKGTIGRYIGAKIRYFFWFFYVFSSFFRLNFQKFLKIMKLERN